MDESATEIEGIVLTGIYTRKQESFAGAHTTFDKKKLQSVGATNIFQALKNLDPSLNIIENSVQGSNPNASPEIEIRGASSFPDIRNQYSQNPNMPLFILDGFETTAEYVMDMDMNRIQWVTILKDAAAKAIYGSKAANGVVVIETVRLSPGKLRINFNSTLSVTAPDLSSYNMCNAEEKLGLEKMLGLYDSDIPARDIYLKDLYYHNLSEVRKGVNTDWLAQPLRTGISHKQSLNIEAGDETIRVGIDLGYNNIQGVMKGSKRTIMNGAANIVYTHGNILFRNTTELNNTSSTDSPYGEFSQYAEMNPYWRVRDENGNLVPVLGYGPVFTAEVYNPNNVGKDMVYGEMGYPANFWYCLMQDGTDAATRKLYVVDLTQGTWESQSSHGNRIIDLSGATGMPDSKYFAFGTRGNVMYHATGTQVYYNNYAGDAGSSLIYDIAAGYPGYEISCMKIYKYTGNSSYNSKLLFVGIYNASTQKGELLQFVVNETNGSLEEAAPSVYSGFGRIVSMNYKWK